MKNKNVKAEKNLVTERKQPAEAPLVPGVTRTAWFQPQNVATSEVEEEQTEASVEEEAQEENPEEREGQEDLDPLDMLVNEIEELDKETVLEWKKNWGQVYVSALNGELFIYRPITRREYMNKMENLKIGEGASQAQEQMAIEDSLVGHCVLHPKSQDMFLNPKGGTISALYQSIMHVSNFLAPEMVLSVITEI